MKNLIVPVDGDLNSLLKFDPTFPFFVSHDDLSDYIGGFVNWHKQSSVEIAVVLEGSLDVSVLEREETLKVGDSFLILPGQLHTVKPSKNQKVARYYTLFFEPSLLIGYKGSFFEQHYYLPALTRTQTFFKFTQQDSWTNPIFAQFDWLYEHFPDTSPEFQLSVQRKIQDIWIILWKNLISKSSEGTLQEHNPRILRMIEYLHQNYAAKFSLTDMAEDSSVSRGECCRFFKKMMHMTISDYLMEYRISKAVELLENTNLTISEISELVGFSSISYFIEAFRKKTRYSPLKYKKILKNAQQKPDNF